MIDLDNTYGPLFIHLEVHVGNDVFQTSETVARASRFGVGGIPQVNIDGVNEFVGAGSCAGAIATYEPAILSGLSDVGYVSPIDIQGGLTIDGSTATVTADIELVDDVNLPPLQATLFLAENDIFWCCGFGGVDTWEEVTRMVRSTPITLTFGGGVVTVEESIDISGFDAAHLEAYAIVEAQVNNGQVYQATDFTTVDYYFATGLASKVGSAPEGNETVLFDGFVQNLGEQPDVVDLSMDNGFGWPAEFQIEGDPTWYTATSVALAANEKKALTIRVQTDSDVRIGEGTLTSVSQETGQMQTITPKVFNGSPAILFVDDDGVGSYEGTIADALDANGYLYDLNSLGNAGTGPNASAMAGYDAVVWQTAYLNSPISASEAFELQTYLDNGGGLFLASMDMLNVQSPGNDFTTNYLGLTGWTTNGGAEQADGVSGDPITDGMAFPTLDWPAPNANRADHLELGGAESILTNEGGETIACRFITGNGSRTVLNTVMMDNFPDGPNPSNKTTLIGNTMDWILQTLDPADVDLPSLSNRILIDASPNPFSPSTELRFRLSDQAAQENVSLVIVDASGRQVRTLVDGQLEAGDHRIEWDGRDDAGLEVPGGVFFASYKDASAESSIKIVRLQ